jgi:protein-disulfide isomerase
MLKSHRSIAIAGGLGGAALAIAFVFGAAAFGVFPTNSDSRIHDYLIAHPQILVAMTDKLQSDQQTSEDTTRQRAVDKIGLKAFFNPRLAFVMGPANARTTFVEMFDYNCPYCRASVPLVKNFMAAHKNDARFAFIEFPIKGPESAIASRAAIAARKQPDKYLDFHFRLMSRKELVTEEIVYEDAAKAGINVQKLKADMQDHSIDMAIAAAHHLAAAANIDGTPAFIINGNVREGALDEKRLKQLLKQTS